MIHINLTRNGQSVVVTRVFLLENSPPTGYWRYVKLKPAAVIHQAIYQNVKTFNALPRNVLKSYQDKQIRTCGTKTFPRRTS